MEGIIFIGAQASGKSTFYKKHFFNTHLRISLDLLNTRNKENKFIEQCFKVHQRFVIDNTNPTISSRKNYISKLKQNKYSVVGYFFSTSIKEALERNSLREGKQNIPDKGIFSVFKQLELPSYNEGFDELYFVKIVNNSFVVKKWNNEV